MDCRGLIQIDGDFNLLGIETPSIPDWGRTESPDRRGLNKKGNLTLQPLRFSRFQTSLLGRFVSLQYMWIERDCVCFNLYQVKIL
jgi:hypothetical protein